MVTSPNAKVNDIECSPYIFMLFNFNKTTPLISAFMHKDSNIKILETMYIKLLIKISNDIELSLEQKIENNIAINETIDIIISCLMLIFIL